MTIELIKTALKLLVSLFCVAASFTQERITQPTVLPFESANNNLFVQVRVNESAPLWFIFDTGAGQTMLDMRSAKALNLKLGQSFQASGGGAKTIPGSFLESTTLNLPTVAGFNHPLRFALPLEQIEPMLGRLVDGVLGYDFIRQFVVEVDFVQRQLRLHDKDNFAYTGDGASLPLTFKQNHPHVRATLQPAQGEPIEADCMIDLGSSSALLLARPFIEKHNLLGRAPTRIEALPARGVGGEVKLQVTRMRSFRLVHFELKEPIAGLSQDTEGAFGAKASAEINVGSEVMRRFRVFLDYSRSRLILEPNAQLEEPFEYDMGGAALEAEGAQFETIKIVRLNADSPALQSGLQVGDILERVGDKPAAQLGLSAIRKMLKTAGTHQLAIKRGDKTLSVSLRLKRRI